MAKQSKQKDDDLLANAIPIEDIEEAEEVAEEETTNSIELTETGEGKKIETFDRHHGWHADWKRKPSKTGEGATHMRTFVCKLRLDAIEHVDDQINEWLDENPDLEVKQVTSSIGVLTGKLKEEAMFITVWV